MLSRSIDVMAAGGSWLDEELVDSRDRSACQSDQPQWMQSWSQVWLEKKTNRFPLAGIDLPVRCFGPYRAMRDMACPGLEG